MKHFATFMPSDVGGSIMQADYATYTPRLALRAIVYDGAKVALIKVVAHGYYMLPGGGVEDGPHNTATELSRETQEELGCAVKITAELGSVNVYFDRWRQNQTDHCYIAKKVDMATVASPTQFEIKEGHQVVWAKNLGAAIRLMRGAKPTNNDGKLIRARDLLFLKSAAKL